MKLLVCVLLFLSSLSFSQSSIWGTVKNGGRSDHGYLYKTDATGDSRVILHHFDSLNGKAPGPVIQASNGKLYGMTAQGGLGAGQGRQGGTLFEYDPVIDSFQTLVHFNSSDPFFPANVYGPSDLRLLEVSPGLLWAVISMRQNNNGVIEILNEHIVSYNLASGAMTNVLTVPSWVAPQFALPRHTSLSTELYKAADGYVYSTTIGYSSCATTTDANNGSVVRLDPATGVFSYIRPLPCLYSDGLWPRGNFAEVNGKLYSSTYYGGPNILIPTFMGFGLIYEYDPAGNSYTRKYDFLGGANGGGTMGYQVKAPNGKLYGTTARGTITGAFPYGSGIIYEYDATTNVLVKKTDFSASGYVTNLGSLWLCSTNGKLYGTSPSGLFEYNTATNQIRTAAGLVTGSPNIQPNPIIEVCQKPAYRPQAADAYTLCAGSMFAYDLQSPNAQSYTWRHNGSVAGSQTTGLLSFAQMSTADAGTWVCEMSNGCGTTLSPTLTITVNPAASGMITSTISPAGSLRICPGASVTLSGNVNGTWNTGSAAPSLVVSAPGVYQVTNTNACGHTLSNRVRVDTIATPAIPAITFSSGNQTAPLLSYTVCQGDSALLLGNVPGGLWSSGESAASIYVKDLNPRYVTINNGCRIVSSATAQVSYFVPPPSLSVTAVGSRTICAGDSVLLKVNGGAAVGYSWYQDNGLFTNYAGGGSQFYAKQTGDYYVKQIPICGPVYSQTIHVDASGVPVGPALITALGSTVICQGGGVVLQSNYASCTWNTGATTQTILATAAGPYIVTNYNSCSSVSSAPFTLSVTPAPAVSFSQAQAMLCFTSGTIQLGAGSPAGGHYSGNGVTGNTFDPVTAGAGTHTVSYSYQDPGTGCTGKASQSIQVDGNPVASVAGPTLVCQGINAVLYQDMPTGTWNTGTTGLILSTTQAGSYYVTRTNACGVSVSSNTVQIALKPSPTVSIQGISMLCSGSTASLSASGGTSSYTWTPGGTGQSITVSPASTTIYTVIATGANGCYGTGYHTLTVQPLPAIAVAGVSVCAGTAATLQASGAQTYTWSNSQTGSSIVVNPGLSTVYQVTGTDPNLCVNTASAQVTVYSLPPAPVISQAGNLLQSTPGATYQWYFEGAPLAGATSQTCNISQAGNYTVVITDVHGCSATSSAFSAIDTGFAQDLQNAGISLFPNPSSGQFTLRLAVNKPVQIRIFNLLGEMVLSADISGETEPRFQAPGSGAYLVAITLNGQVYTQKLIVQQD